MTENRTEQNATAAHQGTRASAGSVAAEYWDAEHHCCIYCGAGNDAHHSYTCPTEMHPDKRNPNNNLRDA